MSCNASACRPVLIAPNGTLWQLGVTDLGLLTTTQVFLTLKNVNNPILYNSINAWQLSVNNFGLLVTTAVSSALLGLQYLPILSPSGFAYIVTVQTFGLLQTATTPSLFPVFIPYPLDVTMSIFGTTCANQVVSPPNGNAPVTVSADFSCWCCATSSFVLPEDTTITVVLDE
jgi:hypothetical protein